MVWLGPVWESRAEFMGSDSIIRVRSTNQSYDFYRPWQKKSPYTRRSLGVVVGPNRVLVTAEVVADHTYVEFENPEDGSKIAARVLVTDYEANLALLEAEDAAFFKDRKPVELIGNAKVGDSLRVFQLESSGEVAMTRGEVTTVEVGSYPMQGQYFLVYRMSIPLRGRKDQYSLPVFKDGKLAGFVMRFSRNSQTATVLPAPIMKHFLVDMADGKYEGFSSVGLGFTSTGDPQFASYLGIPEGVGGVYITHVLKGGPAQEAGLRRGDILLKVGDVSIDQDGNYKDPLYGKLLFVHLVNSQAQCGDKRTFTIFRDKKEETVEITLRRTLHEDRVIPPYVLDRAPDYLVLGGLVFEELSRTYLRQWGGSWTSKAPQRFVYYDRYQDELFDGDRRRIVMLTQVLPTKMAIGYESLSHIEVTKVNGKQIRDLKDMALALESPVNGFHKIEFSEHPGVIYLDAAETKASEEEIKKTYGLPALRRLN